MLLDDLLPAFQNAAVPQSEAPPSTDTGAVKWRSLPLVSCQLRTGFSQGVDYQFTEAAVDESFHDNANTTFFTTTDLPGSSADGSSANSPGGTDETLSQFYDHSFAIHEDSPSLPIPPCSPASGHRHGDVAAGLATIKPTMLGLNQLPRPSATAKLVLTDLKSIPNASYLLGDASGRKVVNLIVGVISIPPPRTVTTRQYGRQVELVELLVGDETRAGFGVTVWLPQREAAPQSMQGGADMRKILDTLRPRDIVLLRGIALSSFLGKVHGQSQRSATKIELLHRKKVDEGDENGIYDTKTLISAAESSDRQLLKVKKVRDWVIHFVGEWRPEPGGLQREEVGGRSSSKAQKQRLPPDTQ